MEFKFIKLLWSTERFIEVLLSFYLFLSMDLALKAQARSIRLCLRQNIVIELFLLKDTLFSND